MLNKINTIFQHSARSLKVAVFLAFKGFVRANIGVTLLTVLILILVALNLLFVPGLLSGLVASANNKLIDTYCSDLIVQAKGSNNQGYKINHVGDLMTAIQSIDGVDSVTARNNIGANIQFEDKTGQDRKVDVSILAIMPKNEKSVFDIHNTLIEGSYLDDRDRDQIILGVQVAGNDRPNLEFYTRSLRSVHAGDKVTVRYGTGINKQYTVKGIFKTDFIQTDFQAQITELEYESMVPGARETATNLNVKLADKANVAEITRRISMFDNTLEYQTWEDNAGLVNSMTTSFQLINRILDIVNTLVAGITIFIVTYVDVINKRRQIGIQRAIGIKKHAIIVSYLLRALCYVIAGLLLSWLLFENVIIPLETSHPFYFPFGAVYINLSMPLLIRTSVLLLIVSLVAALIPVWLTTRIKIMDAIWG
jgi:putative ABC transport system permease protein